MKQWHCILAYTVGAVIEQKSAVVQVTDEGVPVTFDGEGVTTSGN